MKRATRNTLLSSAVVLALGLTSCASSPESGKETTLDLATAKGIAMAIEDETAALVPAASIADQSRLEKASLFNCREDEEYRWSGRTTVTFEGKVDAEELIERIAVAWGKRPGFTVEKDKSIDGMPRVNLTGAEGSFYFASIWNDGTQLYVNSSSPCFHLEGGAVPGRQY